ncbi:MOSC domain-containing protein [Rhodopseudomonas boonkerdii]|uniref:MOSC domain-containing protein n=1 Tax=Rhodopseudomonas boonkerdii TaxID=475937 RepID=UPI001E543A17|nr:MOSC domain-containing protein [Rhodopseudomonas boonkerdii]UGV26630.1 MOSC domain-containing protein [Rhodopseudomonas boonkerdii]
MNPVVTSIARFPVKGLSPEPLTSVHLRAGQGIDGDRAFALALPDTDFDEQNPTPLPKTKFLMLARQEALARLRTRYDADSGVLSVVDGDATLEANTRSVDGVASINAFFEQFVPDDMRGREPRFVRGIGHRFTDVGVHSSFLMNTISILNLASLRDFEQKLGKKVDARRFRMNVLIEGLHPWEEMDWLEGEKQVSIGRVKLRAVRPTRRCPATQVNPDTTLRDIDVPKELLRLYDHVLLGIYLTVETDGVIAVGDGIARPVES